MQITIICMLILIRNFIYYLLLLAYIYVFETRTKQIDFVSRKSKPKYMQKSHFWGKNPDF